MSYTEYEHAELISLIGKAATDPEIWTSILPLIASAGGGWGVQLVGGYKQGASVQPAYHFSNFGAENVEEWVDLGGLDPLMNPRTRILLRPSSSDFLSDFDFASSDEIRRNDLYQTLYNKLDVPNMAACLYSRQSNLGHAIAVFGSHNQGQIELDSQSRLQDLLPHLTAAMEFRLWIERQGAKLQLDALETVGVPTLLLDFSGKVIGLNSAAEIEIRASPVISVRNGRLTARELKSNKELVDAITRATNPIGEVQGQVQNSLVDLPNLGGAKLTLRVSPLPRETFGLRASAAAVVVFERSKSQQIDWESQANKYALTAAERRLTKAIIEGARLSDYADFSGISINTAKSQLKNVFHKTNTSRQSDLIRLFATNI